MHFPEIMLAIIIGGRSHRPRGWEAVRTCSMIISSKIIAIIAIHRGVSIVDLLLSRFAKMLFDPQLSETVNLVGELADFIR